ncbi:MAG: hypothetical protein JWQ07_2874 [Ramlibacter sp.]|nr:hypothetical protein [Ramlibacter sp.]
MNQDVAARVRAGEETESFAHIVVRDLRSPLAAVLGFSQALAEGAGDELSPQSAHYLSRIRNAAQQMDRTMEAIAQFGWLAQAPVTKSLVDLAPIVNDCIAALRQAEPGREVHCSIAPCIWADADPRLLKLALKAILSNAWKYAGHPAPSIEVGIELDPRKQMCYFVRDNGMGFGASAMPSTSDEGLHLDSRGLAAMGIGLATVKRIIDKHDGSIWATWKSGHGVTIHFTLPSPQENP